MLNNELEKDILDASSLFISQNKLLLEIIPELYPQYLEKGDIVQYTQKMSDALPNVGSDELCSGILLKNSAATPSVALEIAAEYEKRYPTDLAPLVRNTSNREYTIIIPLYDEK